MRSVDRGGRVRVDGRVYGSQALWPRIGRQVLVKVDRYNLTRVGAYEPNGSMICMCEEVGQVPALAATDAERQAVSEAMRANRRLLAHARAIQLMDNGGRRVAPAVADRLALDVPQMSLARVEDEARRAELEGAAPRRSAPAQDDLPRVSDADLLDFEASLPKRTDEPAASVEDFLSGLSRPDDAE
jgi:hypothetical protein